MTTINIPSTERPQNLLRSERIAGGILPRILTSFDMVVIVVAIILWIPNAAVVTGAGATAYVYWILGFVTFLIPGAIVTGQLGRMFPREGSIYVWTTKAFGNFLGFLAGFCAWWPGILSMITAGDAIVTFIQQLGNQFGLTLLQDPGTQGLVIIGVLAFSFVLSLLHFRTTQNIVNVVCVAYMGAIFLVGLAGIIWLLTGHQVNAHISWQTQNWLPTASKNTFYGTVLLALLGIEVPFGNRLVAVKEMSLGRLSFEEVPYATEAFKREALLLANLAHQNLPRIYDHFSQNGYFYLVMDFIEGKTIAELLWEAPEKRLCVPEVIFLGEQLCSVLSYLHSRYPPIIFRDIKPANVMVTANREHLYLIDFGIARYFKPGQAKDTLAIGTVGYAPPEQYHMQTTERSDIYSLGATLHHMLSGLEPAASKVPFFFPPLKAYSPQIPLPLEQLIMQMVQPDPDKRPDSMFAVRHELRRVQQLLQQTDMPVIQRTKQVTINVPGMQRKQEPALYHKHTDSVYSLAWSPEGIALISAGADGEVHLWDATTGVTLCKYQGFPKVIRTVAWAMLAKSARVLAGCEDALVYGWNISQESSPVLYRGHTAEVSSVAWSPDATKVVSGSRDRTVRIWDAASGKLLFTYQGHTKEVYAVAWSPDGTRIASAGEDKTVRIWDGRSGKTLFTYQGHAKEIYSLVWSPDGSHIASAGEDKNVHVWPVA